MPLATGCYTAISHSSRQTEEGRNTMKLRDGLLTNPTEAVKAAEEAVNTVEDIGGVIPAAQTGGKGESAALIYSGQSIRENHQGTLRFLDAITDHYGLPRKGRSSGDRARQAKEGAEEAVPRGVSPAAQPPAPETAQGQRQARVAAGQMDLGVHSDPDVPRWTTDALIRSNMELFELRERSPSEGAIKNFIAGVGMTRRMIQEQAQQAHGTYRLAPQQEAAVNDYLTAIENEATKIRSAPAAQAPTIAEDIAPVVDELTEAVEQVAPQVEMPRATAQLEQVDAESPHVPIPEAPPIEKLADLPAAHRSPLGRGGAGSERPNAC